MKKSDNLTPLSSNEYDSNITNTIPYYNHFHEETINLIKSMDIEPEIWLDTGCGTGTFVEKAIQQFENTNFILADPSDGMLSEAGKKLAKYGHERAKFLKPVPSYDISLSRKVDIITAILSHHYMTKEERFNATKSCYDLLKKNGVYVAFENISPFTEKGIEIGKKYWRDFQISRGKDEEDVENHINRFNTGYFPINVEEHLSLFRKCGFEVIELFWYSYMQAGFYCIK
jgi:tRNA (cmo5U34)-methyltransferase